MPHVYRHIRLDKREPFYIGIGVDDFGRRANDKKARRSKWWNRIVDKHGYEVQILFEEVSIEFAKEKEKEFIALYGRLDLGTGTLCNLTDGGDGANGWKAPVKTIERMKEAAKIRGTYMLNTPEVIAKRAESNRGKKRTPEQCEKLAAWQRGVPKPKEQVEKMRQSRLKPECVEKARNQPNCKKVLCLNNGIIYRSCAEAGRQLGMSASGVTQVCLNVKAKIKGYMFTYELEQQLNLN